jgi:hypothetical protein
MRPELSAHGIIVPLGRAARTSARGRIPRIERGEDEDLRAPGEVLDAGLLALARVVAGPAGLAAQRSAEARHDVLPCATCATPERMWEFES